LFLLYGLFLEIVEFIADSLLKVFNMDLAYFEANVPVAKEIVNIIIVAGWAILIGNLVFQANRPRHADGVGHLKLSIALPTISGECLSR